MSRPVLPRPRAVVFDWDNTLVDSWLCIQECYNRTFLHFGMRQWDMDETRANVARSLRDSFPSMFGNRWEEAREVFYRSFAEVHLSYLKPLPGAAEMLTALAEAGIYLSVVSNKVGDALRTEADALGWTPLFGRLIGATDAEADKPHPAPVRLALEPANMVPGDHVWFVGDSGVDVQCAVNSGCTPILLRPETPQPGEFDDDLKLYHISDCKGLASLVREVAVPISPV